MKTKNAVFLVILPLVCIGLLPGAQAVVPPPDGGYPGFNTAEGTNALKNLATGSANAAVGWFSLFSVTTGSFNTGVGAATLVLNTGDDNTATGAAALLLNTTGADNTANGTATLVNNSTGSDNTAVGAFALNSNTASGNTAIGSQALLNNTTGGTLGNVQGFDVGPNVAVGWQALESNTVAGANTAVGYQALHSFTGGPVGFEQIGLCTAVGFQALANATGVGLGNSGFGYQALTNDTDGVFNTAIGFRALFNNTTGGSNTAIGNTALLNNIDGGSNTAFGGGALSGNISGNSNTALGVGAGVNVATANNVICIGEGVSGADVSESCYIGSIWAQPGGSQAVYVNADGKLGAQVSSRRFKEEIKPMEAASQVLFALKPVTFRYKKQIDSAGTSQFGLVAEEVEKVNPDLVVRDKEGKPYSVRYDQVNAMLLSEFLKEHCKVRELEAIVAQQQKGMEAVLARLNEYDSKIQKVSLQFELSRSATKLAGDNH